MSLDDFNQELRQKNLMGYWMIPTRSEGFREPQASFEPFLWKWREISEALEKSTRYIQPEEAFRRFIGFQHPKLKMGTTHTLLMGAQMILPGEFAPAHRHMMEAIRFVVKGRGAATIVNGEQIFMEEGDLITTPNWAWHDHINADKAPIIWLDGANGPMIQYYQAGFSEPYPQKQQPVTRPAGWSENEYGVTRPPRNPAGSTFRPPYRYRWSDTEKKLRSLGEGAGDPFDGAHLRYADPAAGGYTLPTMSCEIQLLRPGEKGRSHRHTYTAIYHAFRGCGSALVGDTRFDWEEGDSFVVPPWSWHTHENSGREPGILFSINDRPAIEALGFFREQTAD